MAQALQFLRPLGAVVAALLVGLLANVIVMHVFQAGLVRPVKAAAAEPKVPRIIHQACFSHWQNLSLVERFCFGLALAWVWL